MRARLLRIVAALGLAAALGGCNPAGYSAACYGVGCPHPPAYQNSYAGYAPVYAPPGRPAFGELPFDDPFADYLWRGVTISPGAGNSQAANTALQTATPWPRYSNNTNIPGNGAQMVRAVHDFECGTRPKLPDNVDVGSGGGSGSSPVIQVNNNNGTGAGAGGPQPCSP